MVDEEGCEHEWPRFRRMLIRGIQDNQFNNLKTFLLWFLGGTFPGAELFPHLSLLLTIVCVLPVGSCSNERVFSRMKNAKTRLRNALGEDMLEWILITQTEGPTRITNEQTDAVQETTRIQYR